jgi:type-F conjugative transfer system pilin assembly protein TrbC
MTRAFAMILVVASFSCLAQSGLEMPSDAALQESLGKMKEQVQSLPSDTEIMKRGADVRDSALPNASKAAPSKPGNSPVQDIPAFMYQEGIDANTLATLGKGIPDTSLAKKGLRNLLIMVSFSMPEDMLASYAKQAKEVGAILVMRGLVDGSLSKTTARVQSLNIGGSSWEIDPPLYRKFKIAKVPSFVLVDEEAAAKMENDCAPDVSYLRVDGDVSIRQALELMRMKGAEPLAKVAQEKLLLIEGRQ